MSEPQACPDCLRRSWLLASLGPYVERIATGSPGSRSPELLRLANEDLVAVAAPKVAAQLLGRVAALSERHLAEELRAARCWACCRHGDLYPQGLRDAADAPWALIGRGDPGLLDGLEPFAAVTVVGSRRATSYGREIARELGRELASARAPGPHGSQRTSTHEKRRDNGSRSSSACCAPSAHNCCATSGFHSERPQDAEDALADDACVQFLRHYDGLARGRGRTAVDAARHQTLPLGKRVAGGDARAFIAASPSWELVRARESLLQIRAAAPPSWPSAPRRSSM